ncbi:MAG: alpha/beta fold hydrolase [Clostridiales bacterium]|nr:alpha/beta fold hydrolase [Clostridiales bacterium]
MKKALKNTVAIAGCLFVHFLLNRIYFKFKSGNSITHFDDQYYPWRFGSIRYRVKGRGEPLLLIHGIYPGADMTEWQRADAALYQSYQVYTIDLLGFGHSEKPNISYSAYLYTRLINSFIKDVVKRPVIAVASDYSAAYTVMGYVFDPSLYKKLVLISPAGIEKGDSLPTLRDLVRKWLLEIPILGTSAYICLAQDKISAKHLKKLRREGAIASYAPPVISSTAFVGGFNAKLPVFALLCKFLNVNIKSKLNRIEIPMLILSRVYIGLRDLPESLKSFLDA